MLSKSLSILCNTFLALLLLVFPLAWALRDGLGPDSYISTGLDAVFKAFMTFYTGPLFIVTLTLRVALARLSRSQIESGPRD